MYWAVAAGMGVSVCLSAWERYRLKYENDRDKLLPEPDDIMLCHQGAVGNLKETTNMKWSSSKKAQSWL